MTDAKSKGEAAAAANDGDEADFLDRILMSEQSRYTDSFSQGRAVGPAAPDPDIDSVRLRGFVEGAKVGYQVGFYRELSQLLQADCDLLLPNSADCKAAALLKDFSAAVARFRPGDTDNVGYHEDLTEMSLLLKKVCVAMPTARARRLLTSAGGVSGGDKMSF